MTEAVARETPRESGKAETRQALLEAAAEVIASKGYEKASLAEIAKRAGLTTGAVYSTYGSKWDLMQAVIDQLMRTTAAEQIQRSPDLEPTADLSLNEMLDQAATQMHELVAETDLYKLGALQFEAMLLAIRNPAILDGMAEATRAHRAASADAIAESAAQSGHTLPLPPELTAALLNIVSQGLQLAQFIDREFVTEQAYRDAFRLVVGLPIEPTAKGKARSRKRT